MKTFSATSGVRVIANPLGVDQHVSPYVLAKLSAYSPNCKGCSGITKSGQIADSTQNILAADLRYWDLGDKIEICFDKTSAIYTIADTGSAIRGKWRFDVLVDSEEEAISWGIKHLHVQELND